MVTTAAPYYTLRPVRFESAEDFVDEVKPFDGPFMSATLGLTMDYVSSAAHKDPRASPTKFHESGTFHAIFEHDQLILVLVHTPLRPTVHFLGFPSPPAPPLLSSACALLAKTISPSALFGQQLAGPRDALAAFLAHLPTLRASPPLQASLACTADLRTLPSPLPARDTPAGRYLIRAGRPEDAPAVLPLAQELLVITPAGAPPPEKLLADLRFAAARRLLFVVEVCDAQDRTDPSRKGKDPEEAAVGSEIAGYVVLGSSTPRVVWIRQVLVHAAHRRRGLAERLVGAVTRACLGASRDGPGGVTATELASDADSEASRVRVDVGVPGCGVKSAVCLMFSDPGAGRVYGRCGFVVDEGAAHPVSGAKLCYSYEMRGISGP